MVEPRQSLIAPPPGVVEEAGPNPVGCAVAAALIVLAGWWVVIMASRLPVESTERAHTVLQRRTARTAVGLAAFAAVLFAGRSSFGGWLLVAGMIAWMGYAQVPGDRSVAYRATFLARPVVKATERLAAANRRILDRRAERTTPPPSST